MSVRVRRYRRGGWEVDIRVVLADETEHRQRRKAPVSSKSAAQRWGQDRERAWYRQLIQPKPKAEPRKEVPTLEAFAPRFMDGHARANRQKPGGVAHKDSMLRVHLVPHLGTRQLDRVTNEDVQQLKYRLREYAPKSVNNVLTVLNTLLKKAVEWEVIDRMPCSIRLLKAPDGSVDFYDVEEYERLRTAAERVGLPALLVVLLGGDAGLRSGEMRALRWADVNFAKRQLCVERGDWRGQVSTTKGGRLRYVPLTTRLVAALQRHRHLKGSLVLAQADGAPLTANMVVGLVQRAAAKAGLRSTGPHMLRHTFCSHLAMKGAPVRAIQELAGHRDLTTTQRYMHLSPAAIEHAIRLLEYGGSSQNGGDMLETGQAAIVKANG